MKEYIFIEEELKDLLQAQKGYCANAFIDSEGLTGIIDAPFPDYSKYAQGGWVSVDERLPEDGELVFVVIEPMSYMLLKYTNEKWIDEYKGHRLRQPPLYWMKVPPIPEKPPKPEYEYYFEPSPSNSFIISGWYPIETNRMIHPEKIEEYIAKGILRRIEK